MLNAKFQKEIFYAKLLQISGAFQVLYSKKQIVFPWRASERASGLLLILVFLAGTFRAIAL